MITRKFGRTGLDMPVFSCGGMRYQHAWKDVPESGIPAENQRNLEATIRRAVEVGINHIETARGYGSSERQLGKILPEFPRDSLIVQTKVGPAATGEEYEKNFASSLERLQLDHVDLLAIHGINNRELLEKTLAPGGSLDAAKKIQKEGRAKWIGFSTHASTDVIIDACRTGKFDYVNLHWYWVQQVNWPAIVEAGKQDMGVFIISPNDKGGKLYEPPEKLVRLCDPLSPMQFNDLFCLSHKEIHTLSIGASKPSDFDNHLEALTCWEKVQETVAPIEAALHAEMGAVLGKEWLESWDQGLPRWEDTPGEIHIREILRLWNYAKSLDMNAYGKMRYNLFGNGGHWFPGTNAASVDRNLLRPELAQHPFPDRVLDCLEEAHELLYEAPKKRISAG